MYYKYYTVQITCACGEYELYLCSVSSSTNSHILWPVHAQLFKRRESHELLQSTLRKESITLIPDAIPKQKLLFNQVSPIQFAPCPCPIPMLLFRLSCQSQSKTYEINDVLYLGFFPLGPLTLGGVTGVLGPSALGGVTGALGPSTLDGKSGSLGPSFL